MSAKAVKADLDALKAKQVADSGKLAAATSAKQDKLGFMPYKIGDAIDSLKVGGSALSAWGLDPAWSVLAGDKAANPSIGWARDGSAVFAYTTKGYFGLRDDGKGPIYWSGEPNSPERPIWHAGNLNKDDIASISKTRIGEGTWTGEDGLTMAQRHSRGVHFGRMFQSTDAPTQDAFLSYLLMPEIAGPDYSQSSIALSTTSSRGWLGSGRYDAPTNWAEIWTTANFNPGNYVKISGGTITGDLRISGKLTTNPGATPADYVFEPDYKLASLSEVEAYTKANKHLPEVPSAKEMTENGVDLAAMNMVLLKKVEELTLHAIALQKDVDAQKTLLADQHKVMLELKAVLESIRKN
ncbi:MAG: hypothetical protein AAB214_15855 [Fibrobacterota bacterium]